MRRRVQATFKAVAARFRENFHQLFGGGSGPAAARPSPTTSARRASRFSGPAAGQAGGRRWPCSPAGSGALTAVVALFAVLEANPPPFCVLDEVDAMLDEANVGRFREARWRR